MHAYAAWMLVAVVVVLAAPWSSAGVVHTKHYTKSYHHDPYHHHDYHHDPYAYKASPHVYVYKRAKEATPYDGYHDYGVHKSHVVYKPSHDYHHHDYYSPLSYHKAAYHYNPHHYQSPYDYHKDYYKGYGYKAYTKGVKTKIYH